MTKRSELKPISPQALAAFKKHRLNIIQMVVTRSMKNMDEVPQHGDKTEELLTTGLDFTTQALEVSMQLGNIDIFEIQLQWALDRLPHVGVQPQHLLSLFKILAEVIQSILPAQVTREVYPFVTWLINRENELIQERVK